MLTYNQIINFIKKGNNSADRRVEKTEQEWKDILSDEEFLVARKGQTEGRMTSHLCTLYEPGIYSCICCGTNLFDSLSKYDSNTGWPSFTEPISDNVIAYYEDTSYEMYRIETLCSTCDAHLGHVFPDGPEPTGLRFCINGISLKKNDI